MAEVSLLHFPEDDHDLFIEHDLFLQEFSTLDSFPYFSPPRNSGVHDDEDDIFFPASSDPAAADVILEDRKNQVSFVMDLFHQQVERSHLVGCDEFGSDCGNDLNFDVIEENYDVGVETVDALDLELRLGLGLEDNHDDIDWSDGVDCNCGGFVVSDFGDEFYVARRETGDEVLRGSSRVGGVMVVGIDLGYEEEDSELWRVHVHSEEEEEEDFGVHHLNDDDDLSFPLFEVDNVNDVVDDDESLSIPLCWDSLQLEEEGNHHVGVVNTDLEWEEVDDGVDDREVLSVVADHDEEGAEEGLDSGSNEVMPFSGLEENGVGERGRGYGNNLEWEVLLDVNNLGRNSDTIEDENDGVGGYFGDQDDIFNAAEYELMFGQFAESENAFLSRPPASKAVVEKLPSVITTEEDVLDEKALCAVCKDQVEVGKEGKQLPCLHRYHGDCILPWLGIRNTCPLCRYELPTDDPDYEQRRVRRAARVA